MKADLTTEQAAFRDEVRAFLSDKLPVDLAQRVKLGMSVGKEDLISWTRTLNDQGWAAPHWPEQYGGTGWSLIERHIFDVECRAAQAPALSGFGFNMVGPAIIRYGSEDQKAQFLPAIRNADLWWCQGYSEPQAGSDLASVRTRAVRDGDDYVVNGQKIWTSGAEHADWIFCLVRTDTQVQQQKGISFLLIDLDSPGVQIEPLYAFNGKRLWNQVFFDDVRVPVAQSTRRREPRLDGGQKSAWRRAPDGLPGCRKQTHARAHSRCAERNRRRRARWRADAQSVGAIRPAAGAGNDQPENSQPGGSGPDDWRGTIDAETQRQRAGAGDG